MRPLKDETENDDNGEEDSRKEKGGPDRDPVTELPGVAFRVSLIALRGFPDTVVGFIFPLGTFGIGTEIHEDVSLR